MNYIAKLQTERDAARETVAAARTELEDLLVYLSSPKFQGDGADYVHIRTDLMPKLMQLRGSLLA